MTMINDTQLGLAKRLKAARLLRDLEQLDLALVVGVARQTVSNWERGVTEPNLTQVVKWAAFTGQPLEWFAEPIDTSEESRLRESNSRPSHYKCNVSERVAWGLAA
jgi:transcriptional regulator with XRE-family HTH domain